MSKDTENKNKDLNKKLNQEEEEHGPSASNEDVHFVYPDIKYEFLDNTADIQIHAWGDSIEESFEQVCLRKNETEIFRKYYLNNST